MKKIAFLYLLLIPLLSLAQDDTSKLLRLEQINDGPYIFVSIR